MSADNWTICPRCHLNFVEADEKRILEAEKAYGKVSSSEYLALLEDAKKIRDEEQTFREDYELGIDIDGSFAISYSGSCTSCGLGHGFKHEGKVDIAQPRPRESKGKRRTLSTYEKICKERCEWCAGKEVRLAVNNPFGHWLEEQPYGKKLRACTAPSPIEFIEEQAARIAELEKELDRIHTTVAH